MSAQEVEGILESLLNGYQLRVSIVSDLEYCGTWYDREPAAETGQFHLIKAGECLVSGPSLAASLRLGGGDLVVFPHGTRHTLSSSAPAGSPPSAGYTSMLCGELAFVRDPNNPVLDALPQCLIVKGRDGGSAYRALAGMLIESSRRSGYGRQVAMNKLADCLFSMAVCEYARQGPHHNGVFAGIADPRLIKALHAIHTDPARAWTIQQLAEVAAMSRSAFAERFSQVMGLAPMRYLTCWRITQAKRLLQNPRLSVGAIAERVGYRSEAAFRRLFKRMEGAGIGSVRAAASVEIAGEE